MKTLLLLLVSLMVLTGATCVNKGTILHSTLDGGTIRKEYISDTNWVNDGTNYAEVHVCGGDGVSNCLPPTIAINPNASILKQTFTGVSTMGAAAILRDSFNGNTVSAGSSASSSAFAGANTTNRRKRH